MIVRMRPSVAALCLAAWSVSVSLQAQTRLQTVAPPVRRAAVAPSTRAARAAAAARAVVENRARRLGLGTRAAAHRLLFDRPLGSWVAAARGRAPRRFLWPVNGGILTQGFRANHGQHQAIDVGARCGTPIRAGYGGLVGYAGAMPNMGNVVVLVHPGGWVTAYGHNRHNSVEAGAIVRRGQTIAEVGDTGDAHGCHVHFIVYRNGARLDPEPRMEGRPRVARR